MEKRENDFVNQLSELDKSLSESLSLASSEDSPLGSYRKHMKFLEYSCHGVIWISLCIAGLYFSSTADSEAVFFNLLLALILDIIFVGVLKAVIHRQRPSYNKQGDMLMTFSVDKMSCPSGHTSRAVFLFLLLISSESECRIFHFTVFLWCFSTCASRVILGRHYLGDVLLGVALGFFEYLIICRIWAEPETAGWYVSFFKDSSSFTDDF